MLNIWYEELTRPPLRPPNRVFGPVWKILYSMIVVPIVLYYQASGKQHAVLTPVLLLIHIVANFSWTSLFCGPKSPLLALLDIIALEVPSRAHPGRSTMTSMRGCMLRGNQK